MISSSVVKMLNWALEVVWISAAVSVELTPMLALEVGAQAGLGGLLRSVFSATRISTTLRGPPG
jgi:hypothetical protein